MQYGIHRKWWVLHVGTCATSIMWTNLTDGYTLLWCETETAMVPYLARLGQQCGCSRFFSEAFHQFISNRFVRQADIVYIKCHWKIKSRFLTLVRTTYIVNVAIGTLVCWDDQKRNVWPFCGKCHKIHQNICEQVMGESQLMIIYAEG